MEKEKVMAEKLDKIIMLDSGETVGILRTVSRRTSAKEVKKLNLEKRIQEAVKHGWMDGLGLAAVQIGVPVRMAWYSLKKRPEGNPDGDPVTVERILINPEIVEKKGKWIFAPEGCLSIPDKTFSTDRYLSIVVKNEKETFEAVGLEAILIQHELDHMDGILACDRVHKTEKIGRNEQCPCGSGKKFKKCCISY